MLIDTPSNIFFLAQSTVMKLQRCNIRHDKTKNQTALGDISVSIQVRHPIKGFGKVM